MLKRIGLIGDVHARDERLNAALNIIMDQNLDANICTGDIMDGPAVRKPVFRCSDLMT